MTLPLTRHSSGRAAPLPEPAAEAPPAPPVPETREPARVVIPVDDSDDPDVVTVLTGEPAAEDIAAAAGRHRRAAALATGRAERDRAEAEQLLEDARTEAARIIAAAEAEARPLVSSAGDAEKEAAALAERAKRLTNTATAAVNAEAARDHLQALQDERAELAAKHAEIGERLAGLATDRLRAEADLAEAREDADLERMTVLRNRVDSIDSLAADLRGKQAPMAARLAVLGTGAETADNHPLPLPLIAQARGAAGNGRRSVREGLNYAWPERPEAVADARLARLRELEAYEFRTETAPRKPPPRTVVHL